MRVFDIILILDDQYTLLDIQWYHPDMEKNYGPIWHQYIGQPLGDVFDIKLKKEFGELEWKDEKYSYIKLKTKYNRIYFFLKCENYREYLYEKAMDYIPYPLSIYDKSAFLIYMNEAARKLWEIPDYSKIDGRHLLDLFDVDKDFSTVLTTLRTGAPVINRIDDYYAKNGVNMLTINTGYPICRGSQVMGATVLEQSLQSASAQNKNLKELQKSLEKRAETWKPAKSSGYTFDSIIGHGAKLSSAVSLAKKVAAQNCNILLVGETGTGKEIIAQSIHKASLRKEKNFVAVNCAAFPDALIESLLFGTQKGSFTGSTDNPGLFEEANGGTLFLDELNSMSLNMQSKILRVLQEGVFRRVGGKKERRTDVRIIASCNADPFHLIAENLLRKDLFYRISVVMIELPPLREHIEDMEELVFSYVEKESKHFAKQIDAFSPEVLALFRHYHWPGNVRELYHVLDYALNVGEGRNIELAHLPAYLQKQKEPAAPSGQPVLGEDIFHSNLQQIMDQYEEQVLRQVLEHHGFNISRAAEALGIRRQSLQYRIKKLGIII